jgi:hypothetical protein
MPRPCVVGVHYCIEPVWLAGGCTTGKPSFAVRENLCRAFSIGRTAKNFFAVRFI